LTPDGKSDIYPTQERKQEIIMAKKNIKVMPARRSIPAIALQNFRSARFRHKAEDRGGAVNDQAEYLADYNVDDDDDDDVGPLSHWNFLGG
jgi:hypothetical protein